MSIKKVTGLRISRDSILFFSGLGLIINEAARNGAERPTFLLLFGAMVGLPQFLNRDEKEQDAEEVKKEAKSDEHKPAPSQPDSGGTASDA